MLSRVVLNARTQTHTFTTPRLRCTLRNRYCSLFSANETYLSSERQLETSQAPPPAERRQMIFQALGFARHKRELDAGIRSSGGLCWRARAPMGASTGHRLSLLDADCVLFGFFFVQRSAAKMRMSFVLLL